MVTRIDLPRVLDRDDESPLEDRVDLRLHLLGCELRQIRKRSPASCRHGLSSVSTVSNSKRISRQVSSASANSREERAAASRTSTPSSDKVAALVARLDTSLEGHAVRMSAGAAAAGMARRAAAELKDRVVAEDLDERGHVPDVDPPRCGGEDGGQRRPVLVEVQAAARVGRNEVLAHQVEDAERRVAIAFELADDGSGMEMVSAGEPQPLHQHAEVDSVRLLPVEDSVQCAVDVKQHYRL